MDIQEDGSATIDTENVHITITADGLYDTRQLLTEQQRYSEYSDGFDDGSLETLHDAIMKLMLRLGITRSHAMYLLDISPDDVDSYLDIPFESEDLPDWVVEINELSDYSCISEEYRPLEEFENYDDEDDYTDENSDNDRWCSYQP